LFIQGEEDAPHFITSKPGSSLGGFNMHQGKRKDKVKLNLPLKLMAF
jgi:hypothetical protein